MVQSRLIVCLLLLVAVTMWPVALSEGAVNADTHRYQPAYQECIPTGPGALQELSGHAGENWFATTSGTKRVNVERTDAEGKAHDVPGIGVAADHRLSIEPHAAALGWQTAKAITLGPHDYTLEEGVAQYADYVYGTGRDLYELEDTPQGRIADLSRSTLHGIASVTVYASIEGQGRVLLYSQGKLVYGSWEVTTGLIQETWEVNPVTGAEWTWQEIDDLQAGIELRGAKCYSVKVLVQAWVGSQTFYPITPVDVNPGASGAWTDVDCSALIDVGATGVILHIEQDDAANSRTCNVRKNGSSDNRLRDVGGNSHCWTMIGVDANRIFEIYMEDHTDFDVWLVAYTMAGVTFATDATDKSLGILSSWEDIDCSVEAPAADGLIFEVSSANNAQSFGLRMNGSTDARTAVAYYNSSLGAIVGCDNNQIIEGYISGAYVDFWLTGYVTDGATFNTNATDLSLGVTGSWTDLTALEAGAVMGFIEVSSAAPYAYGLREDDSAETIYRRAAYHPWAIVECDADGIIEGEIADTSVDFFLVGWATSTVTAPDITTNAATNIAATTARLNAFVVDDGGEDCEVRFEYDVDSGAPYAFNSAWVAGYSTGESPYVDIGSLNVGVQYFFRVEIKNSDSTVDGDELDFTTSAAIGEPTNLLAVGKDATTVVLTWDKGDGATDTYIRRKTGSYPTTTGDGSQVYFGSLSSCEDTGRTSGVTYYYSAWGYSGGTYSAAYATDFVTLPLPGSATGDSLPVPSQPGGWFQSPDTSKLEGIPGASLVTDDLSAALDVPAATLWMVIGVLIVLVLSTICFIKIPSTLLAFIIQAVAVVVLSIMGIFPLWMVFVLLTMGGSLAYIMQRA